MICTILTIVAALLVAVVLFPCARELFYSIKIRIMENRSRYL